MLRTVKFLSTFSCVSLRDMKETGAASRPVPPNHSDIRRAQVLQPPDSSSDILRGSSLFSEQSPTSSQLPPYRDFGIIHQLPRVCQGLFEKNFSLFAKHCLSFLAHYMMWFVCLFNTRNGGGVWTRSGRPPAAGRDRNGGAPGFTQGWQRRGGPFGCKIVFLGIGGPAIFSGSFRLTVFPGIRTIGNVLLLIQ